MRAWKRYALGGIIWLIAVIILLLACSILYAAALLIGYAGVFITEYGGWVGQSFWALLAGWTGYLLGKRR